MTRLVACCTLALLAAPISADEPPKRYAVLVAVGKYDHPDLRTLKYTGNDVAELAEVLADKAHGYAVTTLTDATPTNPTKANIEAAVRKVLDACKAGDTVVIGLAGHGVQFEAGDDAYFCPSDAKPVKGRAADTMVSMKKLYEEMKGSNAGVKVLLVDACRNDPKGTRNIDPETMRPPAGVAALFSCSAGECAYETEKSGKGHGVFFHHVIQGLKGEAVNKRVEVTFASLVDHVQNAVVLDVDKLIGDGAKQQPNMKADLKGYSPVLVKLASGGIMPKKEPRVGVLADTKPYPLKAPFTAKEARATQRAWAKYLGREVEEVIELPGKIKIKFLLIPPATFTMGSPKGERGRGDDEVEHEVVISKPFYLAATETTLAQYNAFNEKNGFESVEEPVQHSSWDQATAYCEKMTTKVKPTWGKVFKLPTEAQWEYACRAGTETPFDTGDSLNRADAYFGALVVGTGDSERRARKVGSFRKNPLGLYDMHGNVWEWCEDWYDAYAKLEQKVDPVQTEKNLNERVCRGGSWANESKFCRSAQRNKYAPGVPFDRWTSVGFRIALVVE